MAIYAWIYAAVLYRATMYLTHHYLIDVVGGACLSIAIAFFYISLPDDLKCPLATDSPIGTLANGGAGHCDGHSNGRSKYEICGIEAPLHLDGDGLSYELWSDAASDEEETGIAAYRSPGHAAMSGDAASNRDPPTSAMPLLHDAAKQPRHGHKHTAIIASIASLIRADDCVEDGRSAIGTGSFVFPLTPTHLERDLR